jgi:Na+/melibiose symporter-like transporter
MLSKSARMLTAAIGTALVMIFVFGLAQSISAGFAGFWGGLPFWVIAMIVMFMAAYDFYDETVRKKD